MPTTPLLGINQLTANQAGKETTINDAIVALESATNAVLAVSYAATTTYTLSAAQATRNMIFKATAGTAASQLVFPVNFNGNPLNRVFVVRNDTGFSLTVKFASGSGSTVSVPHGHSRLIAAIDGLNMIVAAEPATVVDFISLTDVPQSYVGLAGKALVVNAAEDGLEFVDRFALPSLAGNGGKLLAVKADGSGVQWVSIPTTFAALTDTPANYNNAGGKFVAVKGDATGLEFVNAPTGGVPEAPTDGKSYVRKNAGWAETTGSSGAAQLFGNNVRTDVGPLYNGGIWFGNRVLVTEAGTITSVSYHLETAKDGINAIPAIYADNNGTAGALLADGPTVANGVVGKNDLPLSSSVSIEAGQYVWIGCFQAMVGDIRASTGSGENSQYFLGSGPAPANAPGLSGWNAHHLIYGTGVEWPFKTVILPNLAAYQAITTPDPHTLYYIKE